MPQNPVIANPQTKAVLATAVGVIFLAGFAALGFWYGTQQNSAPSETPVNATGSTAVNTATQPGSRTISGTIAKISNSQLEVRQLVDGNTQTVVATLTKDTIFQKWDFRTSAAKDKGVAIKLSDLSPGVRVVISTADTSGSSIAASRVSMVIYP